MKDVTINKICRKLSAAYMYAQVVFSAFLIVFGAGYAIMNFRNIFIAICFGAIAVLGCKLFRLTLSELRTNKYNSHE